MLLSRLLSRTWVLGEHSACERIHLFANLAPPLLSGAASGKDGLMEGPGMVSHFITKGPSRFQQAETFVLLPGESSYVLCG